MVGRGPLGPRARRTSLGELEQGQRLELAHLDDVGRADAWTEIERTYRGFRTPSGVAFPGEVLVGAATK